MANPGPRRPADALFPNRRPAIHAGICVLCGNPATQFRDDLSRREYEISGLCQKDQDLVFREDNDLAIDFENQ